MNLPQHQYVPSGTAVCNVQHPKSRQFILTGQQEQQKLLITKQWVSNTARGVSHTVIENNWNLYWLLLPSKVRIEACNFKLEVYFSLCFAFRRQVIFHHTTQSAAENMLCFSAVEFYCWPSAKSLSGSISHSWKLCIWVRKDKPLFRTAQYIWQRCWYCNWTLSATLFMMYPDTKQNKICSVD